jgi:hypothetical protein
VYLDDREQSVKDATKLDFLTEIAPYVAFEGTPPSLHDGGLLLFAIIVSLISFKVIKDVLLKDVGDSAESFLKKYPPRVKFCAAFFLLVLIPFCYLSQHLLTFLTSTVALVILASWPTLSSTKSPWLSSIGQFTTLFVPLMLCELYYLHATGHSRVYVSLAFEPEGYETTQQLEPISRTFKETIADIFAGFEDITIETIADSSADSFGEWSQKQIRARLKLVPDFILCNYVSISDTDKSRSTLTMLVQIRSRSHNWGILRDWDIKEIGPDANLKYLCLRASFDLIRAIRNLSSASLDSRKSFPVNEEQSAKKRLLAILGPFLQFHPLGSQLAIQKKIEELNKSKMIADKDLQDLFDLYDNSALATRELHNEPTRALSLTKLDADVELVQ